jgi:hypothetical protein
MRLRVGTLLTVTVAALSTSPGPAAAHRADADCHQTRSWVLVAAGEDVHVWRTRFDEELRARYYACYQRRGSDRAKRPPRRPTLIATSRGTRAPRRFSFAGQWVVFANLLCGRDAVCGGHIVLVDAYGRGTHRVRIPQGNGGPIGLGVTPRGAVAWIWVADLGQLIAEVWVLDSQGQRMVARDSVDRLIAASFAVSQRSVYWTQNGLPASAPLHRSIWRAAPLEGSPPPQSFAGVRSDRLIAHE